MNSAENIYHVEEDQSKDGLKFFFIRKGQSDIIKVVQYLYVQKLKGRRVYNLGFGDYDMEEDIVHDDTISNNGDVFKVFNTVLSTIPVFFRNYGDALLMVSGSDSRAPFAAACRLVCRKKCVNECKNVNRRIRMYSAFVNKNYKKLSTDYQFFGSLIKGEQHRVLEDYVPRKNYDSVFLFKNDYFYFMKIKASKSSRLVKVSESALLSLVASKLKDRDLFPKKTNEAKKYLKKVKE